MSISTKHRSHKYFTGKEWIRVESPEKDYKITQLSVGFQSVWAVTNDSRVWYRKGIDHGLSEGTSWIKLNTFMFSVSITPNDQVNSTYLPIFIS